jgi:putative tricarboxylic transport membrane protein
MIVPATTWRTPAFLLVALIVYAVVLKYTVVGYVLSTVAFVLVAARLMSTRPLREVIVRDLLTAVGLSVGIYLVFTRLLGIVLPAGVLPL